MQLGGSSRVSGSTATITVLTLIMLGAMVFAIPPSRIETRVAGTERGYLVSHSSFSAVLASSAASDGYTYLAIDLTDAESGDAAHWATQVERVNEVRFAMWGWIELGSATEVAADARNERVSGEWELAKNRANRTRKELEEFKKTMAAVLEAKDKKAQEELKDREARADAAGAAEEAAAVRAEAAREAAIHASAKHKLEKLVPALSLRGVYLTGPGAVARAVSLRFKNPSLKVLPVIAAGSVAPDGPHAVLLTPEEFKARAGSVQNPILRAAGLTLEQVEATREGVDCDYLVARIRVGAK